MNDELRTCKKKRNFRGAISFRCSPSSSVSASSARSASRAMATATGSAEDFASEIRVAPQNVFRKSELQTLAAKHLNRFTKNLKCTLRKPRNPGVETQNYRIQKWSVQGHSETQNCRIQKWTIQRHLETVDQSTGKQIADINTQKPANSARKHLETTSSNHCQMEYISTVRWYVFLHGCTVATKKAQFGDASYKTNDYP